MYRIGLLGYGNRTRNLWCSATVNDAVIPHQVTDNAQSVVNTTFGFFHDLKNNYNVVIRLVNVLEQIIIIMPHHLIATANENGHRLRVGAFFNYKHAVFGSAKR